jgi:hypothetical protein
LRVNRTRLISINSVHCASRSPLLRSNFLDNKNWEMLLMHSLLRALLLALVALLTGCVASTTMSTAQSGVTVALKKSQSTEVPRKETYATTSFGNIEFRAETPGYEPFTGNSAAQVQRRVSRAGHPVFRAGDVLQPARGVSVLGIRPRQEGRQVLAEGNAGLAGLYADRAPKLSGAGNFSRPNDAQVVVYQPC